jgi:hypothetical protein
MPTRYSDDQLVAIEQRKITTRLPAHVVPALL